MLSLSPELLKEMDDDRALLQYLEMAEKLYAAGDKSILWGVIEMCGHYQLVMPEWVRDAIAGVSRDLETGKLGTLDEAFGLKLEGKATRKRKHRLARHKDEICRLLLLHRSDGGSFNAEEAFEPIAETIGISRRDVEAVYKEHCEFVRSLPRKNPDGVAYVIANFSVDMPKRYGRSIVRDDQN